MILHEINDTPWYSKNIGHVISMFYGPVINGELFLQINISKFIYIVYFVQNPANDTPWNKF